MALNRRKFQAPYIGIDDSGKFPIIFDTKGNFSVFMKTQNPCLQYNGDADEYYSFLNMYANFLRSIDPGYALQKHDVFSKKRWESKDDFEEDFLMKHHHLHYEGRLYKYQTTTLILTCELKRSVLFGYDEKKYTDFMNNISKVISFFSNYGVKIEIMNKKEISDYVYRYFSMDFEDDASSLDNFSVNSTGIKLGEKNVRCLSLVDIEYIEMPTFIKPFSTEIIKGREFPHDLFRFIPYVDAETIVYNQVVYSVNQSIEKAKLETKIKRHASVPDPANNLCVEDIERSMDDIERNGQMLIYAHFDLIIADSGDINRPKNQIESYLSNLNIRMSKQAFNQYELFRAAAPGNVYELKSYDKFLTTADVAVCMMYKESLPISEESNLQMWFCDRQGVPLAIDPSDLPIRKNRIDNRNKFVLGPSGSGKSFLMNTMLHQYLLNKSDIVMVDVGHSYKGLSDYFNGRYITYSAESPITMNPFYIRQEEYNIEKVDFLVNLCFLLWKKPNDEVTKTETDILREVIMSYYANYFAGQRDFNEEVIAQIREKMVNDWKNEEVHDEDCDTLEKLHLKIDRFIDEQRARFFIENDKVVVESLSFNSFYEFIGDRIPLICQESKLMYENEKGQYNSLSFDYRNFMYVLKKFYKGGVFDTVLNSEMDKTLFDEQFVVFEIDSIQNNETLFPIITLVIMDVFIQKMRNKGNRKVIIIEEAWKALASPLMANYIKYLFKTVRKFFGEAIVVTQELDDIISSSVVRESIISNAGTCILCDQSKYKDNFKIVADLLSLSEIEQNKIFTINVLDNKKGRGIFKEFYMKRGATGEVYGNEVSPHEYFTYTTERPEKDAVQVYLKVYHEFEAALSAFINDLKNAQIDKSDFCTIINMPMTQAYTGKGIAHFSEYIHRITSRFKDSGMPIGKFLNKLSYEKEKAILVSAAI